MNTEDLKRLAEYMGYISVSDYNDEVYTREKDNIIRELKYNPLTNNDQMVEIMEKFKMSLDWDTEKFHWVVFSEGMWVDGKTINEAVTLAAIAAIKE